MDLPSLLKDNPQANNIDHFVKQFQTQLANKIINKAEELN